MKEMKMNDDELQNKPPIEPHADIRELAVNCMQMFVAFVETGFNPQQAIELVKASIIESKR